jgi:hypothetical protein
MIDPIKTAAIIRDIPTTIFLKIKLPKPKQKANTVMDPKIQWMQDRVNLWFQPISGYFW